MKTYSVIDTTGGPMEYACGGRAVAQGRFLHYLRSRDALIRQEIVDNDIRASSQGGSALDRRIRLARSRQEIADKGLKSSSSGGSAWRREIRREKIRRDRSRRYSANEKLKSSNLDLKIRRAHARQRLVDIDLKCDRLLGSGG